MHTNDEHSQNNVHKTANLADKSFSLEASSSSPGQEITTILLKLMVHCRVQKARHGTTY